MSVEIRASSEKKIVSRKNANISRNKKFKNFAEKGWANFSIKIMRTMKAKHSEFIKMQRQNTASTSMVFAKFRFVFLFFASFSQKIAKVCEVQTNIFAGNPSRNRVNDRQNLKTTYL